MYCPQCRKTKLELLEETNNAVDEPESKTYTCNKCGIYVTIQEIWDDEVLDMIGYKEDDKK